MIQKAPELAEEIAARSEAPKWEGTLRNCPCCNAHARVEQHNGFIRIMCSRWLCRVVEGKTMKDAEALWNEKSFRDK